MKQKKQIKGVLPITALLVDVGGILLTGGWGKGSRELAAKAFALDPEEMENRHSQAFGTYEFGKLTIEEEDIRQCIEYAAWLASEKNVAISGSRK